VPALNMERLGSCAVAAVKAEGALKAEGKVAGGGKIGQAPVEVPVVQAQRVCRCNRDGMEHSGSAAGMRAINAVNCSVNGSMNGTSGDASAVKALPSSVTSPKRTAGGHPLERRQTPPRLTPVHAADPWKHVEAPRRKKPDTAPVAGCSPKKFERGGWS